MGAVSMIDGYECCLGDLGLGLLLTANDSSAG